MITARDKMRTAKDMVRQIGLANSMVETSVLLSGDQAREHNTAVLKMAVAAIMADGSRPEPVNSDTQQPTRLFRGVRPDRVLEFIESFSVHAGLLEMQRVPLIDYIRKRGFDQWDVALLSNSRAAGADELNVAGLAVGAQKRFVHDRKNALLVSGTKRRVASRGAERLGLNEDQVSAAIEWHGSRTNVPDHAYRRNRTRPLLMLHLLRVTHKHPETDAEIPGEIHAAYGLSVPPLPEGVKEQLVSYSANLIAYRELYGSSVDEEDEEETLSDA